MATAQQIKELRDITGAGMMDCKKALEANDNDIEKAIDWLRSNGIAKAAKKSDRIAAEGLTAVSQKNNTAVILEINSETDFVAKNEKFIALVNKVIDFLFDKKPKTVEEALAKIVDGQDTLEVVLASATATIGEKISLRRFEIVEKTANQTFGIYNHMDGKICVIVLAEGKADEEVVKTVAMQIAGMNPAFISSDAVPAELIEKEMNIQLEAAKHEERFANKTPEQLTAIIKAKVNKEFVKERTLLEQALITDSKLTVGAYLAASKISVVSMTRFAVGEGIEKKTSNFAEEVMSQVRK